MVGVMVLGDARYLGVCARRHGEDITVQYAPLIRVTPIVATVPTIGSLINVSVPPDGLVRHVICWIAHWHVAGTASVCVTNVTVLEDIQEERAMC